MGGRPFACAADALRKDLFVCSQHEPAIEMTENRGRELIRSHVVRVVNQCVHFVELQQSLIESAPWRRAFPDVVLVDVMPRSLNEAVMDLDSGIANLKNHFMVCAQTGNRSGGKVLTESGALQPPCNCRGT